MKTPEQIAREKIEDVIDKHKCRCSGVIINETLFVNEILAALAEAAQERAKDTERMDHIERHCTYAANSERYLQTSFCWGKQVGGRTLREAVDVSMKLEVRT